MKRILALVLVLVALTGTVYADTVDLSGMTLEELRSLQISIITELGKRKEIPSFTAPISTYEAGKDFPAGRYEITAVNFCTYITIYDSKAQFNAGKPTVRKTTLYEEDGDSIVFDLQSGMIVEVGFSPARFEPFNGLVFE
ncbi:MAG: hypothetical protein PUE61_00795 [Clostridiales bacterium]|nr:hypothetical protein [Clostridiales bacterium]